MGLWHIGGEVWPYKYFGGEEIGEEMMEYGRRHREGEINILWLGGGVIIIINYCVKRNKEKGNHTSEKWLQRAS